MKLNPEYRTNEGQKLILCTSETGSYLKVISAFGIATAYTMEGNLIGRWEATEAEKAEYLNTTEYTDTKEEEDETMKTIEKAMDIINSRKDRSAWDKGVSVYSYELLDQLQEAAEGGYFKAEQISSGNAIREAMLNGASDWSQYSWGGSALIYDGDIAERLCNPSELKKTRNGERRPNSREEWLDVQARALFQAANRAVKAIRAAQETA